MTITLVEDAELYMSGRSLPVADRMAEVPHSAVASAVVSVVLEAEVSVAAVPVEAGRTSAVYLTDTTDFRIMILPISRYVEGQGSHVIVPIHLRDCDNVGLESSGQFLNSSKFLCRKSMRQKDINYTT